MKSYLPAHVYKSLTPKQRSSYGNAINGPGVAPNPGAKNPWRSLASDSAPQEDFGGEDLGDLRPEDINPLKEDPRLYANAPTEGLLPQDVVQSPWSQVQSPMTPELFQMVQNAYRKSPLWTK